MKIIFNHLHSHLMYSLIDSICKPEQVIKKLKENNQNCIAITDHGNTYGAVQMYKLCKKNNIKFIYGCEFYICDDVNIRDKNNRYYHLVILSSNEQGRINLNKLLSIAHIDYFYYKPRIDFNLLKQYSEGLIILSACQAGEIQRNLEKNDYNKAKEIALKYKKEFGDNYYIEIQSSRTEVQQKLNRKCVDLANDLKISYTATCDFHYINKEDQKLHSIFVKIGRQQEVGETYTDTYIQSEDEVRKILGISLSKEEVDIAINNTVEIANKCNAEIPLSAPQVPHVEVPKKFKDENEYLKYLCNEGWKKKGINKLPKEIIKKYKERLYYEYESIKKMGFSGYFLLVESYANIVKKRGIARGSGGGSLIAYLLNIVDIDAIEHDLYFERFIDVSALDLLEQGLIKPEELKIPDVDLDFGCADREKVIEFISNKYGENRVASIGSFMYMWDRTAIKDIGKVMEIPFEITNQITKTLGEEKIEHALEEGLLDEYKKEYKQLFNYAQKLAGLPKSFSKHPCGKIITINELNYYSPITKTDGETVIMMNMDDIESLGVIKADALGLRTIDVIYDTLQLINKDYDYINPKTINYKDKKILKNIFWEGNTVGVFQFESSGMQKILKDMKPENLNDLSVATSLYRPGSIKYIDNYINRKFGKEKFEYLHPDLKHILEKTYSIIIFQEQLIEIGRLAKLRNPDEIRKACAKKKKELMAKVEPELKNGLIKRGWAQEQVNTLWEDVVNFAKYSFNKSHAQSYSIISYITAFLKFNHPLEFMCSLINSYQDKPDEHGKCYYETQRLNVKINTPKLNNCSALCQIKNNEIIYGIKLIKHCNVQIADELFRLGQNEYYSFYDLLVDIKNNTSVRSNQLEILVKLNFFNKFSKNKKLLNYIELFNQFYNKKQIKKDKVDNHEIFIQYARETAKSFMDFQYENYLKYLWNTIPDEKLSLPEQLQAEKEFLGYCELRFPQIKYNIGIVLEVDLKYTPKLLIYNIQNGIEEKFKIPKKIFKQIPLEEGDIIHITDKKQRHKYKYVDGEYEETEEFEMYIQSYNKPNLQKLENYIVKLEE